MWLEQSFLKKFLDDSSTIKYAEIIIDVLTRCKTEEKKSSSEYDRSDVYMQHDSYWILETFKKNAELIGQKCPDSVIYSIADKLKRVLECKRNRYSNDFIIGKKVYRISISRVVAKPIDDIPVYKENNYTASIKQFSSAQLKDAGFNNDTWLLNKIEPETLIPKDLYLVADNKNKFITGLKNNLPKNIDWESAENYKVRLDGLYLRLYEDYSQVWLDSLTNKPLGATAKEILSVILRDILLAKCKADMKGCFEILNSFVSDKYRFPVFKRLALFCMNKHWNSNCSELLEMFFKTIPNGLAASVYETELFAIIEGHFKDFNDDLQKVILSSIENPPKYYQINKQHLPYWNYKWYSALRNISPKYKKFYEEAKALVGKDKPHNPGKFESGAFTPRDKSPMSKEEILNKPVHELIEYLNKFQESGVFDEQMKREGLSMELRSAVKESPSHFTQDIKEFNNVQDFLYVHSLLGGLRDACSENKNIDWKETFDFMLEYIKADFFKDERLRLLDDAAELIKAGCKDDKTAFEFSLFNMVEKIFDLIIPHLEGEENPETQRDPITYAINTTLGKTIEAFIHFSLRKARVNKKPDKNWGKSKYNQFLDKGIEAYIFLGLYLTNIRYLDEKYTDDLLKTLLASEDNNNWKMFMEGYLFGGKVYRDIYDQLRGHYEKAMSIAFVGSSTERSLVTHITLGYLYFNEALTEKNSDGKDSLFYKLLNSPVNKLDRWKEIVRFLWFKAQRTISKEDKNGDQELKKIQDKIIEFWKWTYDNKDLVEQILGNDYNTLQIEFVKLTIALDGINEENEKWIMNGIPHFGQGHDSEMGYLIGYLSKFEDEESIERAGEIYLKLIENNTPTYKQEDIKTIVEKLYEKKQNDCANKICNIYGRRGYHFLKPSWKKANS